MNVEEGDSCLERTWRGIQYRHAIKGKSRGKVEIVYPKKVVIPNFPHIKRIFSIESGFKHFKTGKAWIEEKVDGYNVRIINLDGRLVGFTRGGILCPFTYEKINENKNLVEFLEENKDLIVVGEVAGPENPYIKQSPKYVKKDVSLFVFDIMKNKKLLPIEERNDLVNRYELNHVREFGYLDLNGTKDIIYANYKDIEGIVLKSKDRKIALKYVFPDSDIEDIKDTIGLFPEVKSGYFIQRIVRSSMFLHENGIRKEEYYVKIGESFIDEIYKTLDKISSNGEIFEDFTISVKDPKTADDLIRILSENLRVDVADLSRTGKRYKVVIRKYYPNATRYWRERIHGKAFTD